nr:MAG TPA: hypothetical protein [Caudoviricetes sp.]
MFFSLAFCPILCYHSIVPGAKVVWNRINGAYVFFCSLWCYYIIYLFRLQ